MKKKFFLLAVLFCSVVASLSLTACGSDGKEEPVDPAKVSYSLEFSKHLLDLADVKIYYKVNNKTEYEKATSTSWTKTITQAKFPAIVALRVVISLKQSSTPPEGEYTLYMTPTIRMTRGENSITKNPENLTFNGNIEANKVRSFLEKRADQTAGYTLTTTFNCNDNSKVGW